MNIYQNKSQYKFTILGLALVIAAASIYYTNHLVTELANGERRLIDVSAQAYKHLAISTNDEDLNFLVTITQANNSIPMIQTDDKNNLISYRNITIPDKLSPEKKQKFIDAAIAEMRTQYEPIVIDSDGLKQYIYYKNSELISQLKYYPLMQLAVISMLGLIAYMAFSNSRRAEQNRVWVGLAKETAHQLGTPLSSLIAWVEYFKADPEFNQEIVHELEKDIQRLEMITSRFSNIGSVPTLSEENLEEVIGQTISYLEKRVSNKVQFRVNTHGEGLGTAMLNTSLFGWVVENIIKNAVDAMNSIGRITVDIIPLSHHRIAVDISDTGKGISKKQIRRVFDPGFTTKKRGWGLGLTLVKRIVENYHSGKIYVRHSEVGKGTTFRIILNQA
ncbi:MAG: HAMP domain-containing sensor histidine kinase [Bacteroidota bacterium]